MLSSLALSRMDEETPGPRMFRSTASPAVASALLALLAGGCADGPSTGPDSARPDRIVPVSPRSAAVEADAAAGSPLRVRVVGADGSPREGVEVRFLRTRGPGRALPRSASTGPDGIAEARYLPGGRTGEARVRADVPEAPWISPVLFTRTAEPSRRLRLSSAGGADQRAETGSQLPRPLAVRALTPDGEPASGVRVAFRVVDSPAEAGLSPDTALTDAEGAASTLLTLAGEPGTHRVRAVVAGPAAGDTVRFRAEAVRSLDRGLRLDSLRPRPLREGEAATAFGSGLGDASEVWIDGRPVPVDESAGGRARFTLPADGVCRPRRRTGLRLKGPEEAWSNELEADVRPAEPALELAVGEARTLTAPGPGECVRLPEGPGRAYRIAVASAARSAGSLTPLALRARSGVGGFDAGTGAAALGGPAPTPLSEADRLGSPEVVLPPADRGALESRLRSAARSELRARGALPARRGGSGDLGPGGSRASLSVDADVAAGDTVRLNFAVGSDLRVSCTAAGSTVMGVARAVGPSVAIVQDTAAPRALDREDFRRIRREFEDFVLPADTAYFGPPADIDGNGRIVVLLTPRVNDLTPRDSDSRIGGFFLPLDLADAGPGGGGVTGPGGATCPASNEGEVLYLAAADPDGEYGPPLDRTGALRNARSIGAHELEHLLSAEQRIILSDGGFGDLQQVWLAEGMAHLAEEIVGFEALGTAPGSNLDFDDFSGSRERLEAFNVFHLQNFGRLQLFLRAPSATPALAAADPGGNPSLRMRGFAWLFSRWLGDRLGDGGEAPLFRRLSAGGSAHLQGIENVESATGRDWRELLREFLKVPVLDDRPSAAGGEGQLASWDLRGVYEGLQDNPSAGRLFPVGYPFSPVRVPGDGGLFNLELPAGAPAYFAAGGAASRLPSLALELTSPDRAPPPRSARLAVTVIRVR